jgi:hypothetical protein
LSLNVGSHKPMTVLIPDTVSHCKPIEEGVGVQSGAQNP